MQGGVPYQKDTNRDVIHRGWSRDTTNMVLEVKMHSANFKLYFSLNWHPIMKGIFFLIRIFLHQSFAPKLNVWWKNPILFLWIIGTLSYKIQKRLFRSSVTKWWISYFTVYK